MKPAAAEFADVVADLMARGHAVRFKAGGDSMRPFIHDGDVVAAAPVRPNDLRPGDVALFLNSRGRLTAHRVLAGSRQPRSPPIRTRGDAQAGPCEAVDPARVLGRIVCVRRGHRLIRPGTALSRWLGLAWAGAHPLTRSACCAFARRLRPRRTGTPPPR